MWRSRLPRRHSPRARRQRPSSIATSDSTSRTVRRTRTPGGKSTSLPRWCGASSSKPPATSSRCTAGTRGNPARSRRHGRRCRRTLQSLVQRPVRGLPRPLRRHGALDDCPAARDALGPPRRRAASRFSTTNTLGGACGGLRYPHSCLYSPAIRPGASFLSTIEGGSCPREKGYLLKVSRIVFFFRAPAALRELLKGSRRPSP